MTRLSGAPAKSVDAMVLRIDPNYLETDARDRTAWSVPLDHYDSLIARLSDREFAFEAFPEHLRETVDIIRELGDVRRVLVVGCGPGISMKMFHAAGLKCDYVGIDGMQSYIDRARILNDAAKSFFVMDGEHLSFDDQTFDCVVLEGSLQHTSSWRAMLAEALRVSSRHVIISRVTVRHLGGTIRYRRRMSDGSVSPENHILESDIVDMITSRHFFVRKLITQKRRYAGGDDLMYFKTYVASAFSVLAR